jgi:hypothetical protein
MKVTAEQMADAWRERLDPRDDNARLVLAELAEVCQVAQSSHVPGDACSTAFREGKRAVWLYIAGRLALPVLPGGRA